MYMSEYVFRLTLATDSQWVKLPSILNKLSCLEYKYTFAANTFMASSFYPHLLPSSVLLNSCTVVHSSPLKQLVMDDYHCPEIPSPTYTYIFIVPHHNTCKISTKEGVHSFTEQNCNSICSWKLLWLLNKHHQPLIRQRWILKCLSGREGEGKRETLWERKREAREIKVCWLNTVHRKSAKWRTVTISLKFTQNIPF